MLKNVPKIEPKVSNQGLKIIFPFRLLTLRLTDETKLKTFDALCQKAVNFGEDLELIYFFRAKRGAIFGYLLMDFSNCFFSVAISLRLLIYSVAKNR